MMNAMKCLHCTSSLMAQSEGRHRCRPWCSHAMRLNSLKTATRQTQTPLQKPHKPGHIMSAITACPSLLLWVGVKHWKAELRVASTMHDTVSRYSVEENTTNQQWCRWWDSNPHDFLWSQDFKSCASAISPHRLTNVVRAVYRIPETETDACAVLR